MRLLKVVAWADAVLLAVTAAALGDVEAGVLALIAVGAALALRLGKGTAGAGVLLLFFGNLVFWTLSGALSNLLAHEDLVDLLLPGIHAIIGLVGFVAPIPLIIWKLNPGGKAPLIAGVAATLILGVMTASYLAVTKGEKQSVQPGDIAIVTENTSFSKKLLSATEGPVAVHISNDDFFWHTFTIDELNVDIKVPVGGQRRITFDAPAGRYDFYCRIPGHELIMKGSLTVALLQ
ncbi:MAG: cupredoxin domain-containing protein [Actinomycetota bacterium]